MKKLFILLLVSFLYAAPAGAAQTQDGLFRWLWNRFQQAKTAHESKPENQWASFLQRQLVSPAIVQVRQNMEQHILQKLKEKRNLDKLVPVDEHTAFLLRLNQNLEQLPPQTQAAHYRTWWKKAYLTKKQAQTLLISRYKRLQNCLSRHEQLAGYAFNPEAEMLFSNILFPAPDGFNTAYQTAEKMFCTTDFKASLKMRRAASRLEKNSLTLQFPSINGGKNTLRFIFSEEDHLVFAQLDR